MTNPQNAIEQAVQDLENGLQHMELSYAADPSNQLNWDIERCKKSITALRALQDVKMRSAEDCYKEERNHKLMYHWDDKRKFISFVKKIQQEAFHAGLMAQPDAKAIRDKALEDAAEELKKRDEINWPRSARYILALKEV